MDVKEILEKLSKKEITADEAFDLIYHRDRKPKIIRNVKFFAPREEVKTGQFGSYEIEVKDGEFSLEASQNSDCTLHVHKENFVKIVSSDGYLPKGDTIEVLGKCKVYLPRLESLSIHVNKGKLTGEVDAETLNISLSLGKVILDVTAEVANISTYLGGAKLFLHEGIQTVNLSNKLGGVKVLLPPGFKALVNASQKHGSLKIDPEVVSMEGNVPVFNISTNLGSVHVGYIKPDETEEE